MCLRILVSLIILIMIYFIGAHIYTKIMQNRVFKLYLKLDKFLVKRYDLISDIVNELNQISANYNIDEILRLKEVASSLRNDLKNIDRRAAFDGELALKMRGLIDYTVENNTINSNSRLCENIQRYIELSNIINKEIGQYNLSASKLKIVTEVFPYSFAARFNGVKPIDLYKQV